MFWTLPPWIEGVCEGWQSRVSGSICRQNWTPYFPLKARKQGRPLRKYQLSGWSVELRLGLVWAELCCQAGGRLLEPCTLVCRRNHAVRRFQYRSWLPGQSRKVWPKSVPARPRSPSRSNYQTWCRDGLCFARVGIWEPTASSEWFKSIAPQWRHLDWAQSKGLHLGGTPARRKSSVCLGKYQTCGWYSDALRPSVLWTRWREDRRVRVSSLVDSF